jgi:hypothetical protein
VSVVGLHIAQQTALGRPNRAAVLDDKGIEDVSDHSQVNTPVIRHGFKLGGAGIIHRRGPSRSTSSRIVSRALSKKPLLVARSSWRIPVGRHGGVVL